MACATPPTPPAITEITLSSIQPGLADETITGSGDHSETYKVPGFHIDFHSTLKIEDNLIKGSPTPNLFQIISPSGYLDVHIFG